jgi:predicted S18 family serine protease
MKNIKVFLILLLLAIVLCSKVIQQCQPIVQMKHDTTSLITFDSLNKIDINIKKGED